MEISAITSILNPLKSGYYSYLACVESWLKEVDFFILIDGGSTDGSIDFLRKWLKSTERLLIIRDANSYWDENEQFHAFQLSVGWNPIIKDSKFDWLFVINADYVLDSTKRQNLKQTLSTYESQLCVAFMRSKIARGYRIQDFRAHAINLRLLRQKNISVGYGINIENNTPVDLPISPTFKSAFIDPINGTEKYLLKGIPIPISKKVDIECLVYGHFFFTPKECLANMRRWDRAFARFNGAAPATDFELQLRRGLFLQTRNLPYDKEEMLSWNHPVEVARVIDKFYRYNMLGATQNTSQLSPSVQKILQTTLIGERKMMTGLLRLLGYRGLKHFHQWVPYFERPSTKLDVKQVYKQQDLYLQKLGYRDQILRDIASHWL